MAALATDAATTAIAGINTGGERIDLSISIIPIARLDIVNGHLEQS